MRKFRSNNGFTLIEIMAAIVIIVIGIFAVMSLVTIVTKGNKSSKMVTTATTLAQDKMEYFKRIDYGSIAGTSTVSTDYYVNATVQNNVPGTNTKTITVDVYWSPATSTSSHKVGLKTIIAQ